MTRQQKQARILIGLLAVCGLIYGRGLVRRPSSGATASSARPSAEPASAQPALVNAEGPSAEEPSVREGIRQDQRRRAASLGWSRDPFVLGAGAGDMSGLLLSGILWDAQAPMAVINGQPVRPGEELDGYRVVSITEHQVVVTDGGQTFQHNLSQ